MSIFSSRDKEKEPSVTSTYTPPQPATPSVSSSPSPSYSTSSNSTTIADGTILDGHIKIEGDIRIEGHIKGTVTSKGKVTMSKTGKVDGDIICHSAEVSGWISGKLKVADILIMKANAHVDGDINTGKLVIESGVKFNGNCSMGSPVAASTATAATTASTPMPPKVGNTLDVK